MKKLLTGMLLASTLIVGGPGSQTAYAESSPQTRVSGVISDSNSGSPVADAVVKVTCGGVTETDTTDASGSYLVAFTADECPLGSVAQIMAEKGAHSGSATGDVSGVSTKLNTAIVNVSMPEYGWIGGILATGAGIGAIAFTRRRYTQRATAL